jgi:polyferredoxin
MSESKSSKKKAQVAPAEGLETEIYAKHQKIYPRQVRGLFAKLRVTAMLALLGIYYGLPWVQWEGRQAVLFDLPERKFHVFGLTFWPQDFFLLALLLVIAALTLFFFTALAGRL